MRESRKFAERTQVRKEVMRKYFLVYEGSETENMYFKAVNSMRGKIGISPLIELIPIARSYSEEGWSNPKKILDRVIENLEEIKTSNISYETLFNRMIDYFDEMKITTSRIIRKSIWETMVRICRNEFNQLLDMDVINVEEKCKYILEKLSEEYELENIVTGITDIIRTGEITYAEGYDKICLIVDRDRESFVSASNNDQYAYVLNKCKEAGFGFYVTNPCFEFWLLLHFDEVFGLDQKKLLENSESTSARRYTEQELRRLCPRYDKSSYNAEMLVNNIDKAIENERAFCEDTVSLENTLGSNVGTLITAMRIG